MTHQRFQETITTGKRLREIIKEPSRFVANKVIDHVDDFGRKFIEASPFVVVASTGRDDAVDLSPKGDPAGFVQVLDAHTLAIPERLGNNRVDTLCNLVDDDRIGAIFLVPGKRETLRISGLGSIVRDAMLNDRLAHNGRPPNLAVVIKVQRVFFHCSKCMIRSHLWEPANWPETDGLPTLAETMKCHGKLEDQLKDIENIVSNDARTRLY